MSFSGSSIAYPTNVKNSVTVTGRELLNLNGAVEFRPTLTSRFFVRSFFAKWDELQLRNRFDEGLGDALTSVSGPSDATVASDRVQVNLRSEPTVKKLGSVTLGGGNQAGRWHVHYVAQYTDNSVDEPNDQWEFRSGASTFGPDTFHIDESGAIRITSPGRDRQDPSYQVFRRLRYFQQLTTENSWAGTLDVRRDMLFGASRPGFVKAGLKFMQTSRETAVAQDTYNIGTLNWTAAESPALTRSKFTNPVPLQATPNLWLDLDGLNNFFQTHRTDPRYFALDA